MSGYIRHRVAQTAGHSWDGGLQVYNNPVPRPWLWLLLLTGLLALGYWLLYPSWPLPGGHYQGLLEVEIQRGEARRVVPWSTAAELEAAGEVHEAHRQRLVREILRSDYYALLADKRLRDDILAMARVSYMDRCSACHGVDGHGVKDLGADLVNGPWRADAEFKDIEQQLEQYNLGRHGGDVEAAAKVAPQVDTGTSSGLNSGIGRSRGLSAAQIKALTIYVQQLAAK